MLLLDLDEKNPYLDKKPNYERDYKTGKYLLQITIKTQNKIPTTIKKRFFQECGVLKEHIENYINFTNPPEFRINPDYPYEDD